MRSPAGIVAVAAGVALIGSVPRILHAAGVLPDWIRLYAWSDALYTWVHGLSGGRLPYWDSGFYPPGIGYVSALLALPFGGHPVLYVGAWAIVQGALAAGIAALLLAATGDGRRTLLRWSLAPPLLLHASANFDLLVVAPVVLAVVLLRRGQLVAGWAWLAVGAATKLFPLVALPAVAVHGRHAGPRTVALAGLTFVAVLAAFFLPGIAAPHPTTETLARFATGAEKSVDSIWYLVEALIPAGPDGSGAVLVITVAGFGLTYLLVVIPAAWRARDPAVPVALGIFALLLWSRLFSVQYSLWVLPFFALLPISKGVFRLFVVADLGVFLTVHPFTFAKFPRDELTLTIIYGGLVVAMLLRHVALLFGLMEVRRMVGPGGAAEASSTATTA